RLSRPPERRARRRVVAIPARGDRRLAAGGDDEALGRRGVKVAFLVTRCPAPPWRGDQVRAYHHLRLLARRHDVTCVVLALDAPAPAARAAVEALGVRLEVVHVGLAGAAPALARVLAGDPRPLQVLLWARRRARARVARLMADADVVHAQLLRTLAYLPDGAPVVLDLIDALSANLAR